MKKVVFHYPVLNNGGAEKSTLRMLRALCDRDWQVTLVLTTGGGTLEPEIDSRVTVVRLRPRAFGGKFLAAEGPLNRLVALPDLLGYAIMWCVGAVRMIPFLFRRYDAAATGIHGASSFFIRRIISCRRRFHWIRSDLLGADPQGTLTARLAAVDSEIDGYICVSGAVRRSLLLRIPAAKDKAWVIYNILDIEEIVGKSLSYQDDIPVSRDGLLNIVSVCRLLDRDKGLYRIVRVCRYLIDQGFKFRWFLIGDGPDRAELVSAIRENKLSDCLFVLGNKENPYPYYAASDLVAMVSYHEGLSGMINEAKVCGKSVFAVRVSGVDEQLTDGVNGWLVDNSESQIIAGLRRLLLDPALVRKTENRVYPEEILSDAGKIDRLEHIFLGQGVGGGGG